jgi:hypothetical protein
MVGRSLSQKGTHWWLVPNHLGCRIAGQLLQGPVPMGDHMFLIEDKGGNGAALDDLGGLGDCLQHLGVTDACWTSASFFSVMSQKVSMAPVTLPSVARMGAAVKKSHLPPLPIFGKKTSAS